MRPDGHRDAFDFAGRVMCIVNRGTRRLRYHSRAAVKEITEYGNNPPSRRHYEESYNAPNHGSSALLKFLFVSLTSDYVLYDSP